MTVHDFDDNGLARRDWSLPPVRNVAAKGALLVSLGTTGLAGCTFIRDGQEAPHTTDSAAETGGTGSLLDAGIGGTPAGTGSSAGGGSPTPSTGGIGTSSDAGIGGTREEAGISTGGAPSSNEAGPASCPDGGYAECDGICLSTQNDPSHCGNCENVCDAGLVCFQGRCALHCSGGSTKCNDTCVDTKSDPSNCGSCGKECAASEFCANGTCVSACPSTLATCGASCVDDQNDPQHCGSCSGVCAPDHVCRSGACACSSSQSDCSGSCVSILTDATNCGGCSNSCSAGQLCANGACVNTCPSNLAMCGASCVDEQNDPQHCGACSGVCPSDHVCRSGTCVCTNNQQECNGACVSTFTDAANCGDCGNGCAAGQLCANGACVNTCPSNLATCGASCVDEQNDPQHCGACSGVCPSDHVCRSGTCVCTNNQQECNGACVSTFTDAANCGGCGKSCPDGQVCSQGQCAVSCLGGTTKCGAGCVNVQNDPSHCGVCDSACSAGNSCVQGKCQLQCVGGSVRCGTKCVDIFNDPLNCGACSNACDTTAGCTAGQCTPSGGPVGGTSSCQPRLFAFNSETPGRGEGAPTPTVCSIEPDGTLAMLYSVAPDLDNSWANCKFAIDQNMNVFDADNGGSGVLEVVLCSDGLALGQINLRYGLYPNEKHVTLLPSLLSSDAQAMQSGCRARYFSSADACFDRIDLSSMEPSLRSESLPETCSEKCGSTPAECLKDYSKTPLILTVEWSHQASSSELRLLTVRHFPVNCACTDDSSCRGSNEYCRKDDTLDCSGSTRFACSAGVCVTGGTRDCGDMVGRTAAGTDPSLSPAFTAAFLRHYPHLGCPYDNGGGPYVHEQSTVEIQDYKQPDTRFQLDNGEAALIYNQNRNTAYLLYADFWNAYACIVQPSDYSQAVGGGMWLGPPTNEKHIQMPEGSLRQDFELGWMTQTGTGPVQIHPNTPMSVDPSVTAGCTDHPVTFVSP